MSKRISLIGILLGVMLVLSLAEGLLPPIVPPFGRIGLPNIVIIFSLLYGGCPDKYSIGWKEAGTLTLLKSAFAFITRGFTAGMLSLGGGLLSFCLTVLLLALTRKRTSLVMLGITGALAHNFGQVIVFSLLMQTNAVAAFLPAILIAGVVTGFATGTLFKLTMPALSRTGLLTLCMTLLLTGCSGGGTRVQTVFSVPFNTVTTVTVYAENEAQGNGYAALAKETAESLHKLFDIYNNYEGINNLKTINDNAGIEPVTVDPVIIELLSFAKQAYEDTNGAVNITFGAVLRLWHSARETGVLPDPAALEEAAKHCDINNLIINPDEGTVFLRDPAMSLDVGAAAKGFAAQKIVGLLREKGANSLLLDMGGNVAGFSGGREAWRVGIRDPHNTDGYYDIIQLTDGAVVSSGGYERYVSIDGKSYHHIIDPQTLYPAERYASVTVIHSDSAVADMLSTALFILPKEEGELIAERFGAEVIYIP